MQSIETLNEGLKRAYTIRISAGDIDTKVDAELRRVAPQVRMPGFRPGKVPANLVRKMHGPALMQEALNSSIQEGVQQLLAEQRLRPAVQPSVALDDGYEAGGDAEVKVVLEVLPEVPTPAIDDLKLERLTVPVDEAAVDEQLARLADQQKKWDDADASHPAATGDLVVMDFVGKVDGTPFEGGTGSDMSVELGSGQLIPGFEDQVVGVVRGDERRIAVTFPEAYQAKELAGRGATFDLTIKMVKTAAPTVIDDALAASLGLESLDQLRGLLKGQVEQELGGLTRTHMKRKLLDQLAEGHDFAVPPSMVEAEFNQIWQQLETEADQEADPAAARTEMETERDDYRKIAERRVRLGLLLSEIGQANGVVVSQQEMNRLISQASQRYRPEERQRFMEYVQQEPMAAAQLRAPLYEDKVVDWLFDRAEISEREVTRDVLEAEIEADDGHVHGPDCGHDHADHHADAAPGQPALETNEAAALEPATGGDPVVAERPEPVRKPARKARAAPAGGDASTADKAATAVAPSEASASVAPADAVDLVARKPARRTPAKKAAD